uniref:Peroxisomal sarcosine oxidase-like n=1 Tax=Saccoglossus kowalevskii TaxID=10224 RepID=A0ABM0M040_SACKO
AYNKGYLSRSSRDSYCWWMDQSSTVIVGYQVTSHCHTRQATFVATPNLKDFTKERFPVWSFLTPKYHFYGFPMHGNTGVKIGMSASGPTIHPDQLPSTPDPKREKTCLEFMNKRMPKAVGPILYTKTCLYDMTPDRKYIIDSLATKGYPQIYVCSGAGHAYKFVGLFGKILSEMVIDGRTKYPIGPFRVDRDALTDKNFEPDFHFKNIPKSKAKL